MNNCIVIGDVCYDACTPESRYKCACVNAAKQAFLCPDNTACDIGVIGFPCVTPIQELATICDGNPSTCYTCSDKNCDSCYNNFYIENN